MGWNAPSGVRESDIPEVFNIEHLAVQFMAAFVGLMMAAIAFLPEFVDFIKVGKKRRRHQMIKIELKRDSDTKVKILGDYSIQW